MRITPINPPEVKTEGGLTATLTHKKFAIRIDPADTRSPVLITESKGWIDADGLFKDWGPHTNYEMDPDGFREFQEANGGDCKISDLMPAILDRRAKVEKAKADEQARADAQRAATAKSEMEKALRDKEDLIAKTTVNRASAKMAGPDAVETGKA